MGAISKANLLRRIAAWVLDAMLVSVLIVGAAAGLSAIFGTDNYLATMENAQSKYEAQYGISSDISREEYNQMTAEEKASYDAACDLVDEALSNDSEAMAAWNTYIQLFMLTTSLSILIGVLIGEFAIPLLLKNGQTVGKKAFSIGVVRVDGVKASTLQLLVRALLGKYTIETMLPIFLLLMILLGIMGIVGLIVIVGLLLLQIIVCIASKTNSPIHDLMAGTVAVDLNTQKVFNTTEDLVAHVKRIHADRAARQDY